MRIFLHMGDSVECRMRGGGEEGGSNCNHAANKIFYFSSPVARTHLFLLVSKPSLNASVSVTPTRGELPQSIHLHGVVATR